MMLLYYYTTALFYSTAPDVLDVLPLVLQKTEKATGKKSKVPLQLDIGTMLEVLERKHQSQKSKHDSKPLFLSGNHRTSQWCPHDLSLYCLTPTWSLMTCLCTV